MLRQDFLKAPLPKIAPLRIVNQEDEYNSKRNFVPILPYTDNQMSLQSKETSKPWWRALIVKIQDDQYSMDLNTLMFIPRQAKERIP